MLKFKDEQLAKMSDLAVALAVLRDRHDRMADPKSTFCKKLRAAMRMIEQIDSRIKTRQETLKT